MDKEFIKQQIVLLLTGEKTDISEDSILKELAGDPELQREYDEISLLLETSKKPCPSVSTKRWSEFTKTLNENLAQQSKGGLIIKFAEFFKSPIRASASVAAILIIGLLLIFLNRSVKVDIVEEPVENEVQYVSIDEINSIEQIDQSFILVENLIPSDEELAIIENIFAEFRTRGENATKGFIGSDEIEIEELRRYYNIDVNEDIS